MELLARHIAARHVGERVMMLATGDIRNIEAEDAFRAGWESAGADSLTTFVEVEVTSRGLGSLRDSLTDVRRNILVAPGEKRVAPSLACYKRKSSWATRWTSDCTPMEAGGTLSSSIRTFWTGWA